MSGTTAIERLRRIQERDAREWSQIAHLLEPWDTSAALDHEAIDLAIAALEKANFSVCIWCGIEISRRDPDAPEKVVAHLAACPGHPMRSLEADLAVKDKRIAELERAIPALREQVATLIETRSSNPITGAILAGLVRGRNEDLQAAYDAILGVRP